jgi:hypothetical protein
MLCSKLLAKRTLVFLPFKIRSICMQNPGIASSSAASASASADLHAMPLLEKAPSAASASSSAASASSSAASASASADLHAVPLLEKAIPGFCMRMLRVLHAHAAGFACGCCGFCMQMLRVADSNPM